MSAANVSPAQNASAAARSLNDAKRKRGSAQPQGKGATSN